LSAQNKTNQNKFADCTTNPKFIVHTYLSNPEHVGSKLIKVNCVSSRLISAFHYHIEGK